ncbi:MAG: glycosyltransferase family 2 protein [Puniceicoccaceae bacterium]
MEGSEVVDVSVVIPCFNSGKWIREAVESVRRLKGPTRVEILISDDGSTDPLTLETLVDLENEGLFVVRGENGGPSVARNRAIELAKGAFIVPLDADDRILPEGLELLVAAIEGNEAIGVAYGRAQLIGEASGVHPLRPYSFPEILFDNVIYATAIFRKSDWRRVGGYRESMRDGWEDYDFWLKFIEVGLEVRMLPELIFEYRQSAGSRDRQYHLDRERIYKTYGQLWHNHRDLYEANLQEVFKAHLDRREWWNELPWLAVPWIEPVDKGRFETRVRASGFVEADGIARTVHFFCNSPRFESIRFHPFDGPCRVEVLELRLIGQNGQSETYRCGDGVEMKMLSQGRESRAASCFFVDRNPRVLLALKAAATGVSEIQIHYAVHTVNNSLAKVFELITELGDGYENERNAAAIVEGERAVLHDRKICLEEDVRLLEARLTAAEALNDQLWCAYRKELFTRRSAQAKAKGWTLWLTQILDVLGRWRKFAARDGRIGEESFEVIVDNDLLIVRSGHFLEEGVLDQGWIELRVRVKGEEPRPLLEANPGEADRRVISLMSLPLPASLEVLESRRGWRRVGRILSGGTIEFSASARRSGWRLGKS